MKNLEQQIAELNAKMQTLLPAEVLGGFARSIADIKALKIEGKSIGLGEKFPNFSLPNSANHKVELSELTKGGKLIVAYFRGSWCPYCNLELQALQNYLPQFAAANAALVAISPQATHHSQTLKAALNLEFELLSDVDNALAKQLGISFELQDYASETYMQLGIALSDFNENSKDELPAPAVFVVDSNQEVRYKFVDTNYMNRVDIQELLQQL